MSRTFFNASTSAPLLILGASTRAAAQSAIRAGFTPTCGDLFADLDLCACARVLEMPDYPHDLVAAAAGAPQSPWIYAGGLENHPAIVRRISESRPLWGNGAEVLEKIRDPWRTGRALASAGLPVPRVWPRGEKPPTADGTWMYKPVRGAAGRGIGLWNHGETEAQAPREAHYFQERREGRAVSGLYLAQPGTTLMLGITRQLVGLAAVHAPPFAWCGTIAPAAESPQTCAVMTRVGEVLAAWAGLQGLFGCDFLIDAGVPWLTEVNPRYPASTELVEHLLRVPLLDWHRRACEAFVVPPSGGREIQFSPLSPCGRGAGSEGVTPARDRTAGVIGKIILYAERDLTAPDLSRFIIRPRTWMVDGTTLPDALPYLADIPVPGTRISAGQPICTLFARARNEDECLAKLVRRTGKLESRTW